MSERTHFGDPCIHCGLPHDEVPVGPCTGTGEPIVVAYRVKRQAWQNSGNDLVECHMSDGSVRDEAHHPSEHWSFSDRFKDARALGRSQ